MDYGKYHDMAVESLIAMTKRVTKMALGQVKTTSEQFEAAQDALEDMEKAYDSADWTVVHDIFINYILDIEVPDTLQKEG